MSATEVAEGLPPLTGCCTCCCCLMGEGALCLGVAALATGSVDSLPQPKLIWEAPPGAARTLEEGLSVIKLPTFWPSARA